MRWEKTIRCVLLLLCNDNYEKKGKMRNLHFSLPTKEKGTGLHIDAESWLNEAEHHATEMNHGPETCSRT